MEDIILEQAKDLIRTNKVYDQEKEESLCIRFTRKKYKCIILWMLSIIAFSQLIIIVFDKMLDEKTAQKMTLKIQEILGYEFNST
jgi:hypothetical protein